MRDNAKYNDLLNAAFSDEKVLSADLRTLKKYMLACVEMREVDIPNPRVKEGIPKRMEFIREMIALEMRARELRLNTVSVITAALFALGAFLLSLREAIKDEAPATPTEAPALSVAP